jgi:hypothetical protein
MFCRQCFYALDGLPSARCPECGGAFDPGNEATYFKEPRPPVPWQCNVALQTGYYSLLSLLVLPFLWPPLAAVAIGFALVGITRRGLYRRRRGWIALALALGPLLLVMLCLSFILFVR